MTSPLPPAGGYAPVNLLEAARLGVVRRGNRIYSVLSGLMVMQLLFMVLILGGAAVSWASLGSSVGKELPGVGKVPQLSTLLWAGAAYLIFTGAALVVYLLSLLAARRAIRSVQRYAAQAQPGEFRPDVRGLTRWLSFWQWYMLVVSVASLASIPLILNLADAQSTSATRLDPGGQAFVTGFTVVGSLISLLPTVVLTWLILNAVKRFFRTVELRSTVELRGSGAQTPVQPAASAAGSWLIFVIVVLAVLVVFIFFYAALLFVFAAVPSLLGSASESSAGLDSAFGGSAGAYLPLVFIGLGVVVLITGAVYGLLIAVVAWSRGFALDVAQLLDGGSGSNSGSGLPSSNFGPGGAMNVGVDAWRGAVAPPEPPPS